MQFKVWGTDTPPESGRYYYQDVLNYIFIEDIEAENMLEACRQARETEKYRYFRVTTTNVTGHGAAVEFDSQSDFPESELAIALGVVKESHEEELNKNLA